MVTTATLDSLIREVQGESEDPLVQLEAASQRAGELAELGDALLTHFVDRCRRSGRTWAEIGQHLGVTRQAAQKRFVDSVGANVTFERFTMRARAALDAAEAAAIALRHSYIGTEHQLLGLFDLDGGLALQALTDLGITRAAVEREVHALVENGPQPVSGPLPFTPRARKVLEEALNVAAEIGTNYIGTEHLLLGLYRGQDGLALKILEKLGASREATKEKVLDLLKGFKPT